MFGESLEINNFVEGIQRVKNASNDREFHIAIRAISDYMKKQQMSPTIWQKLDTVSFYSVNDEKDSIGDNNRLQAQERVIKYISELMGDYEDTDILHRVLNNFCEYLEAFREPKLHGKATLQKSVLNNIVVNNEYDIHFLLFSYLKPIFPKARTEVSEDTGYETVRTDILVDQETCIEVKCSRPTLKEKALGEQIKADILHYKHKVIYFFIYDKEKIINNPLLFKEIYEKLVSDKTIYIIIHQPKRL